MMLLAGMDTTANALVVGTWEVLQNEEVYRKLTEELFRAIPNKNSKLSADMLDKLPYLVESTAVLCSRRLLMSHVRKE